jgi:hypothetical protein
MSKSDWTKREIGRLAMRVEGRWWVAYYAMPATMKGAIELGRVLMTPVQNDLHKTAFMNLMREIVADYLEELTGQRPNWGGERAAPEHERSGRA